MFPTRAIMIRIREAFRVKMLAMSVVSPLQAVGVSIPITPNPDMVPAELPTSEFTTIFGPRVVVGPIVEHGRDPVTDEEVLAFTFVTAAGDRQLIDWTDNPLPQTIHGYAMKTADDLNVIGALRLPTPITYTELDQMVQWGEISFRYPVSAVR